MHIYHYFVCSMFNSCLPYVNIIGSCRRAQVKTKGYQKERRKYTRFPLCSIYVIIFVHVFNI